MLKRLLNCPTVIQDSVCFTVSSYSEWNSYPIWLPDMLSTNTRWLMINTSAYSWNTNCSCNDKHSVLHHQGLDGSEQAATGRGEYVLENYISKVSACLIPVSVMQPMLRCARIHRTLRQQVITCLAWNWVHGYQRGTGLFTRSSSFNSHTFYGNADYVSGVYYARSVCTSGSDPF